MPNVIHYTRIMKIASLMRLCSPSFEIIFTKCNAYMKMKKSKKNRESNRDPKIENQIESRIWRIVTPLIIMTPVMTLYECSRLIIKCHSVNDVTK